jgi:hypothetical protein
MQDSNKKRYWLRGGIIGFFFVFIFFVVTTAPTYLVDCFFRYGGYYNSCPVKIIIRSATFQPEYVIIEICIIVLSILMGLIYGKIKTKKRS